MPSITTQTELRAVRKLPFCYLCGQLFAPGEKRTRDHLPPSSLFLKEDKHPPLILPAHESCNIKEHVQDEIIGELVHLIHGRPIGARQRPLDMDVLELTHRTITVIKGLDLYHFLCRCVRGFHAALYRQWLPEDTGNAFHPPFGGAQLDGNTGLPADRVQEMLAKDAGLGQQALFTATLKKNRICGNTDRVVTRNGKCVYECVWSQFDDGTPICIFGLKIYEWQRSGEVLGYVSRGCVGMYSPKAGRPPGTFRATGLEFSFPNQDELDPFGG